MFLNRMLLLCVCFVVIVHAELESPCPDVFTYLKRSNETDRWYGEVRVSTDIDLEGVFLRIELDRSVDLLVNWFADAISTDQKKFVIRKPTYKLEAGPPILVKFFVKYNSAKTIPKLERILLNGQVKCPTAVEPVSSTIYIKGVETVTQTTKPSLVSPLTATQNNKNPNQSARPTQKIHKTTTQSSSKPVAQCGTQTVRSQTAAPLATHGEETYPGQWPWHVGIFLHKSNVELTYHCGGTLISDRHVVTAAHCVVKQHTRNIFDRSHLRVHAGKYRLFELGKYAEDHGIDSIIVHPNYNFSTFYNDIAIMKLDSPVTFSDYVRSCCLWDEQHTNIERLVGQFGTVVGWGLNEHREYNQNLVQVQMPILSISTCLFSNRDFFSRYSYNGNFCAGHNNGSAVCNGDSGGGLVFPKSGQRGKTIWQLRGIVSLGVQAENSGGICDSDQYSLFTDVAQYLDWIRNNIDD